MRLFAFVIGQLRRRGATAVLVDKDQVVQESARVNLAKHFFRGLIGELPERPDSFRAVVMDGSWRCAETFPSCVPSVAGANFSSNQRRFGPAP